GLRVDAFGRIDPLRGGLLRNRRRRSRNMNAVRVVLPGLVGLCLFALTGCEEEKAGTAPAEPPSAGDEGGSADTARDPVQKLRDAAELAGEAISEGASQLTEKGRRAAEQALEDARPAIEEASKLAGELGRSVDEIVKQAASDLQSAVEALNKRIAEAGGERKPATGDPDAVLAPADKLDADTRAAARARPGGVGPEYVGVWAGTAADCRRIDQEPVEIFAVITPTTIRRYESICNFESVPLTENSATVTASCIAEGT